MSVEDTIAKSRERYAHKVGMSAEDLVYYSMLECEPGSSMDAFNLKLLDLKISKERSENDASVARELAGQIQQVGIGLVQALKTLEMVIEDHTKATDRAADAAEKLQRSYVYATWTLAVLTFAMVVVLLIQALR